MPVSYTKINPVKSGVLVCIDEEKDIYKYMPLESVFYKGEPLDRMFKKIEAQNAALEKRLQKIENTLGVATELVILNNTTQEDL